METKILSYKPSSARNSKVQGSESISYSIHNWEIVEKNKYRRLLLLQLYLKNVAKEKRSFRFGSQSETCAVHPKAFRFLALKEFVVLERTKKIGNVMLANRNTEMCSEMCIPDHSHTTILFRPLGPHFLCFTIVRTLRKVITIIRVRHYSSLQDLTIICLLWFCSICWSYITSDFLSIEIFCNYWLKISI